MREWNKKRKAIRHYDQLAPVYDAQYAEEQKAKIKAALNNTKPRQTELILDMGCGTGLLFEHVSDSANLVAGIDTSSKILQKAKKRAKQLPNIVILRADADYTPFQNQIFDRVFAVTLLQNMPTPLKTLREIKRISKPQSRIIVTGLKKNFTRERFINLLKKAELKVFILRTNNRLKGHVAICKIKRKHLKEPSNFITVRNKKCQPTDPWQKQEKSDRKLQNSQPRPRKVGYQGYGLGETTKKE